MIKICFGFLVLLSFCQAVSPLEGQQLPLDMVVTNRYANVRKGPGAGYDQVVTLYRGDRVRAERKFRNWLRVLVPNGDIGWVREDLVGPWDPDDRPLSNEEADSLKALTDSQSVKITQLEDSSRVIIAAIRTREQVRDSLLALLGLSAVPEPADTAGGKAGLDSTADRRMGRRELKPYERQESVLESKEPYSRRTAFSPQLGVLLFSGDAATAAGFTATRNFSRDFAYRVSAAFSRLNPPTTRLVEGGVNRTFITGGLVYSYKPGRLAVPFAEIGSGIARSAEGDSSDTALDLIFGAGCRLFLTADIALEFGYRGNAVLSGSNDLLHQVYLGGAFHFPLLEIPRGFPEAARIYLTPFSGYQMFSPRFSINGTAVSGMRIGYRWLENLGFEFSGAWLPVDLNTGAESDNSLNAAELSGQALYFPWGREEGFYLLGGGGALLFPQPGRPPAGTTKYAFFQYGAGVDLQLIPGCTLRGEMAQQIFPRVAGLLPPEHIISTAGALRLTGGLNFSF